jgi:hypothetical protein
MWSPERGQYNERIFRDADEERDTKDISIEDTAYWFSENNCECPAVSTANSSSGSSSCSGGRSCWFGVQQDMCPCAWQLLVSMCRGQQAGSRKGAAVAWHKWRPLVQACSLESIAAARCQVAVAHDQQASACAVDCFLLLYQFLNVA